MEPSKILELLGIVDATFNRPKLKTIHDKAMAELESYANDLVPKPGKEDWEVKALNAKPQPPRRAEVTEPQRI